jgi:hypothetical protein
MKNIQCKTTFYKPTNLKESDNFYERNNTARDISMSGVGIINDVNSERISIQMSSNYEAIF